MLTRGLRTHPTRLGFRRYHGKRMTDVDAWVENPPHTARPTGSGQMRREHDDTAPNPNPEPGARNS
jgi:hypothetical protein